MTTKSLLGTELCLKAENICRNAQVVRTLIGNTSRYPSRTFNAFFSFVTGASQLAAGSPTAVVPLVSGARDIYNMSSTAENSDIQRILDDIGADASMIGMLAEGQKGHHKVIGENLISIKSDVQTLYGKLDAIQKLNAQGVSDLKAKKQIAYDLTDRSIKAFKKAEQLFAEAQKSSRHSQAIFDKCAHLFEEILTVAQDRNLKVEDRLAVLERASKQAVLSCNNGQAKLNEADERFAAAFSAMQEAIHLKDEALTVTAQAMQQAEDSMKATAQQAQFSDACLKKVEETQAELAKAKQGIEDILELVGHLKADVQKAKDSARGKLDTADLVVGVVTGVACAPAGMPAAVAAGVMSAQAVHYRETLTRVGQRIYHYLMGIPTPPPVVLEDQELLRAQLDQISSGNWGAFVMKRPSFTVGNFYVNLDGKTPLNYRFNLNEEFPIAKEDLLDLFQRLSTGLNDGSLSPARCLAILEELESIRIPRGEFYEERVGVIDPKDSTRGVVRQLRDLCARRISNS